MGQDNYRYDRQGYGVHLGGDRALNNARALDYPLDTRVDTSWPGLEGSAQLRLRPEVVGELAGELSQRAASASGLPDRLARATAESNTSYADAEQSNSQAVHAAGSGLGDGPGATGGGRGGVGGDWSGSAPTQAW